MRKTILFIKKENLFPNFSIFKKINRFYWWIIFNFFILRTIKKYKNKKNHRIKHFWRLS
jgi:hypothetical protein